MKKHRNIKTHLKRIISNDVFLYYVWFKIARQRKGLDVNFFRRDTDVYIDGYPRSGNTFIVHLVRRLLPELNAVHHLHVVAPIKIAFWLKLPIFILIRDPMECISSKYLKHFAMRGININTDIDDKLLNMLIEDYLNYYEFVKKNKNRISLIYFDKLINSPDLVVKEIQDRLEIDKSIPEKSLIKAKESYRGATNTMGSSLPNPVKERHKSVIKDHIIKSNKYSKILELFESIVNH